MTFRVFRVWCGYGTLGASFTLGALGVGVRVNTGKWVRTAIGSLLKASLASLGFSTVAVVVASASSIVFVTRKASVVSVTAVEASLGTLLSSFGLGGHWVRVIRTGVKTSLGAFLSH
jgi:hypothetical protein